MWKFYTLLKNWDSKSIEVPVDLAVMLKPHTSKFPSKIQLAGIIDLLR